MLLLANGPLGQAAAQESSTPRAMQRTGLKSGAWPGVRRVDLAKYKAAAGDRPAAVTNLAHLPVVRTQQLSDCGAFAPTYYLKTWQESKEHGWGRPNPDVDPQHVMSPGFTYPLTNSGEDAGANLGHVLSVIARYGVASWQTMPENAADYVSYPRDAAWREGMRYRGGEVLEFPLTTDAGLEALKGYLATGEVAVFGVLLNYETYANYPAAGSDGVDAGVVYRNGNTLWASHAFCIIGYDDNKAYSADGVSKKGALLAVNSWGPGWGVTAPGADTAGYIWFGYDYVKTQRGTSVGAMTVTDRIGYQPRDIAILELSHARRAELGLSIMGGPREGGALPWLEAFPNSGSLLPFNGRVLLDVTDFSADDPLAYWLRVDDVQETGGPVKTGEITLFQIERAGKVILECDDLPFSTLDDATSYLCAGVLRPAGRALGTLDSGNYRLARGDLNRDGHTDVAAISGGGSYGVNTGGLLLQHNGQGSYADMKVALPALFCGDASWADYDRDGAADLLLGGWGSEAPETHLYRNDGLGSLAEVETSLPGLGNPRFAWGDYDHDGDLDLALTGVASVGDNYPKIARVYRNDAGTFVDLQLALPSLFYMPLAWTDIDGDGWLDLAAGGTLYRNQGNGSFAPAGQLHGEGSWGAMAWADYDGDGLGDVAVAYLADEGQLVPRTRVLHNDGNFSFSEAAGTLTGLCNGSLDWGDLDGDGLLDLAATGNDTVLNTDRKALVFRQLPGGRFVDSGLELTAVSDGDAVWLDPDGDGDLDLLVSGEANPAEGSSMARGLSVLYENTATGMLTDGAAPATPTGLRATVQSDTHAVQLVWQHACGTPTTRGYEVRLATRAGLNDLVSGADLLEEGNPHAQTYDTGERQLAAGSLPVGSYFWAVRAVGGNGRRSAWSDVQRLAVRPTGDAAGDVNADGRQDVADVVALDRAITQPASAAHARADFNCDGLVNAVDTDGLAQAVIGREGAGANGPSNCGSFTIGPAGGTVDVGGLRIDFPAKALATNATLTITADETAWGYGPEGTRTVWRVAGFPGLRGKAVTVSLADVRTDKTGEPWLGLGRELTTIGQGGQRAAYQASAGSVANGRVKYDLPVTSGTTTDGLKRNKTNTDDFTFVIHLLAASQWRYEGNPKFRITGPVGSKDKLPEIAAALETAYQDCMGPLGLNPAGYRDFTAHPLEVTIYDLGVGDNNEPVAGYTTGGANEDAFIELNSRALGEIEKMKIAATHEFFHVMQNFYDTRGGFWRAHSTDPNLWLNEALATWFETRHAPDPATYLSDNLLAGRGMLLRGGAAIAEDETKYGYAMAPLIQHIEATKGLTGIKALFTGRAAGDTSFALVGKTFNDAILNEWFDTLLFEMLHKPYSAWSNIDLRNAFASDHTVDVKQADRLTHSFARVDLSDYGAEAYALRFFPTSDLLKDENKLALRLDGAIEQRMQLLRITVANVATLGEATFNATEDCHRLTLPNVRAQVSGQYTELVPLVTNTANKPPYRSTAPIRLHYGVVRDYTNEPTGSWSTTNSSHQINGTPVLFPTLACQGWLTSSDTGNLEVKNSLLSGTATAMAQSLKLDVWGTNPPSVQFKVTATPAASSYDLDGHHFTISGGHYRVTEYEIGQPWTPWEEIAHSENTSGVFTLPLNPVDKAVYYVIGYYYTVTETWPGQTVNRDQSLPLASLMITHK